jgi:hypothetical protein
MHVRPSLFLVFGFALTACGGAPSTTPPRGSTLQPSSASLAPLVFENRAARKVFVYPSFAKFVITGSGITVTGPMGTQTLPGAVQLKSTGSDRLNLAPASNGRKTHTYCANYHEEYLTSGPVMNFGYGGDYDSIINIWQSEDAQAYVGFSFTQRDASTVLYESGGGFQPDALGGQYEIYMTPGVDPGYTVGGGADESVTITYGRPGDPEYRSEYGQGDAVVTC